MANTEFEATTSILSFLWFIEEDAHVLGQSNERIYQMHATSDSIVTSKNMTKTLAYNLFNSGLLEFTVLCTSAT